MWEWKAQRRKIIKWVQPKEQLGLTIHQIRPSPIRMVQLVKPRKAAHPRGKHSSEDWRQTTKAIRSKAEEGSKNVQAMGGGTFQIKHPSSLYLMHCTNSVCRINGRMTPEQCLHSLHPTLPPPVKQRWDKFPRKN